MSLGHRKQQAVRYTPEMWQRLERAREAAGETAQAFQLRAVIDRIEAFEARGLERKARRSSADSRRSEEASGLFRSPPDSAPASPQPASGPVVVNVGTGGPEADLISRLAQRVADASDHDRQSTLREARSAIGAYARDEDEQRDLAAKLEREIERKSARRSGSTQDGLKWLRSFFQS